MNVNRFILRLHGMKVSEAKEVAAKIKKAPEKSKALMMMKLVSLLVMASDKDELTIGVEAKAEKAAPDPKDVRFC